MWIEFCGRESFFKYLSVWSTMGQKAGNKGRQKVFYTFYGFVYFIFFHSITLHFMLSRDNLLRLLDILSRYPIET